MQLRLAQLRTRFGAPMPFLKKLFWAYFLLLIFEGALRKWVFPPLSGPLLLIRDPIGLTTTLRPIAKTNGRRSGPRSQEFCQQGCCSSAFCNLLPAIIPGSRGCTACVRISPVPRRLYYGREP